MKTHAQHLADVKKELPTGTIQDGNNQSRNMTPAELAEWHDLCATHRVNVDAQTALHEAKELKKQSAIDKLSALGIDSDELIALLN
jgi:hypothetical protein